MQRSITVPESGMLYQACQYRRNQSLKHLAEHVFFMNPDYLRHLFMGQVGKRFSSYWRRIQMEKAKGLLYNEYMPIASISELPGDHDASLFIKTFKQYVGLTPRQYRRDLKNERHYQIE